MSFKTKIEIQIASAKPRGESRWHFDDYWEARRATLLEDVLSISEEVGQIIILGRNGNAFLVPTRAFTSIEEQQAFLSFVQSALATAASRNRK